MTKMLIVAPHPDDETLGAGGTILKYKQEGKKVYWLNATNTKEEYGYSKSKKLKRDKEIQSVNEAYNFDGFYNLELEPAALDKYPKVEIITEISKIINKVKPNIVILPYEYDVHSDHKIIYECVYACTKSFRYPFVKRVLCMEILSETDFSDSDKGFVPNYFVDITDYLDKKLEIFKIYESEIGEHPFPRSLENIKSLAKFRGASCGVKYAEAFRLMKYIEK
ncbi:PIG-L deacetylase family protein [Marinisporobacter balticus]|uniref:LmbE family N-acetylglucosaminyl deacetylase n=1 Tax=Marinisporobacter balticus TaxID=2018667 RepID=A0A4R2KM78_9FIRM|nr:PIG-L family deacetylase [Marinisporobacter balticus]TCO73647.1 LmbE family N-acetylglucosaminyl deacetylase [Marinisporobacter balticus]